MLENPTEVVKKAVIEVDIDIHGNPKGEGVKGNCLCWLGNLEFLIKDVVNPKKKLLTNYNKREKRFGKQNVGKDTKVQHAFQKYCELVGIERAERINNMWAKKSFTNTTLGVMQLPASQVMVTSGHRSEFTLRDYYYLTGITARMPRWTSTVIFEALSSSPASWMERYRLYQEQSLRCTKMWLISLSDLSIISRFEV